MKFTTYVDNNSPKCHILSIYRNHNAKHRKHSLKLLVHNVLGTHKTI